MSRPESERMVKEAYESIEYPQIWVKAPPARKGWETSNLMLMQMANEGIISRRRATELMELDND